MIITVLPWSMWYHRNEMLKQDLHRAYSLAEGSRARKILECLRSPGVQAIVAYRMGQWLRTKPIPVRLLLKPLVSIQRYHVRGKWGIDIGPEAQIGPGFHIYHYGGIFIAGDVVAGEYLTITHDITIGYSRGRCRQGFPVIGNNVFIAPGAKLAGSIKIGDNVSIGANVVIERNIPDNAVVQIRPMLVVTFPTTQSEAPNCQASTIGQPHVQEVVVDNP
jgi:serine O-acetyltransferase